MQTVLIVFHVLTAVAMVAIVLVQRGAGATAGAAFGAGASATVFGSRGSGSFLTRTTAILATGFFLISLTLAILASRAGTESNDDLGIMSNVTVAPETVVDESTGAVPGSDDLPALEGALEALEAQPVDTGSDVPMMTDDGVGGSSDLPAATDLPAASDSSADDAEGDGS